MLVGFNMTHYSTGEEVGGSLTVSIVREDSLTAVHDFNVKLIEGIGTNATHGKYSLLCRLIMVTSTVR